ncbi:penicillin-binding transpeptidase domain-containing protein [Oceanobacillus picturae]|uniref:penicillin-binding transpeptidase domain-containing protein n=1 Tax=Oceanobacillus picturae TaxID=171693 RepID=UPI000E694F31|nr:penicillin-binding transpeptidase domain-containing protein [Oceanobacillus picturae]RIU94479.1 penicillin-binding transpeptidase domain-containing protein [Oceanobacillus picturae]
MKKITIALAAIIMVVLAGCSDDEVTPNERFDTYVKHWNEQEFSDAYGMLSSESTETYPTEEYVDRYNKIYEDLAISDLSISFSKLEEEELETAMEEGTTTIPFKVAMESMAGPIEFDYEATLVQEGEEDEQNWYVQWDPGFIFPELKDGGEISIQSEAPTRGEILDRNQMPLAINDKVNEIGIIPGKLGSNPEQSKEELSSLIGLSVDAIDEALNAGWVEPDLFVPLKKVPSTNDLSPLWEIDGVAGREVTGRVYPAGEAAGQLVGYIGNITAEELEEQEPGVYSANDMIGKRGLESLYEEQLKGKKGTRIEVIKENQEPIVLAETPVENGKNITLTIDVNVQESIFDSFEEDAGTAAAINPKTGETLALVSSPSFDPNEILYGTKANLWETLQEDEQQPLLNRFSSTFAPGSALKPITSAIGLKNGSIDPNEGLKIDGLTWSNGKGWGDYAVRRVSESSGPVDLKDALVRSDNIYFAMQAVNMGSEAYVKGLKEFGFGEDLPYEYPFTASSISSDGKLDDEVLLANSSYGQGQLEMSSLHLATAYTTFLNEGNMIKPTLLTSEETAQVWKENLLDNDQANLMKDLLYEVGQSGTPSKYTADSEIGISGKTGTAELKLTTEDDSGEENGWFVGFPTKESEQDLLIAMMVENVKEKGGSVYTTKKVVDVFNELK